MVVSLEWVTPPLTYLNSANSEILITSILAGPHGVAGQSAHAAVTCACVLGDSGEKRQEEPRPEPRAGGEAASGGSSGRDSSRGWATVARAALGSKERTRAGGEPAPCGQRPSAVSGTGPKPWLLWGDQPHVCVASDRLRVKEAATLRTNHVRQCVCSTPCCALASASRFQPSQRFASSRGA